MRQKIGVPKDSENGLLEQLKTRKLAKYEQWKSRCEGLVMAVREGERSEGLVSERGREK